MQKVTISIVIFACGLMAMFTLQHYAELNKPTLEDFSVVSQAASVDVSEKLCKSGKCSDYLNFTVKSVSFTVSEYFPYYNQIKSNLPNGRVRIWYDSKNRNKILKITQGNKVIAPFEKLVHIKGDANNVSALIPFGLVIVFLIAWWRDERK
ncbi:hypothetical protein [Pseudoalteromonas sp. Of7M-16]|uniref:hypothetical protein n=1 Tax=Pseudoalteromonas sp. Of7M-16 TaxID=2917756 RepID=UPI001EF3EE83|nr:hypothetical protein [Pseudoalteromonas sp. Of7M-16]MCG7550362.1 hypothetical protein [Pseudoalteromonas sp. Of7M-16]